MKIYRNLSRALLWVCIVCLAAAIFVATKWLTLAASIAVILSLVLDTRASYLEGRIR